MSTSGFDPLGPATELVERMHTGELSPVEVTETYLDRIDRLDGEINAFITVMDETARATADSVDVDGDRPLAGLPVALKDLRDMKEGVRHTFGSQLFAEVPAPRTTVGVERLENAGAVLLGKTNVPEFGHKGATDNELIGPTASPLAPHKNAGGSSGGSAAAVAAGMAAAATGSDSGGSIRIPAAACGIYGLKPSFGLIPIDSRPNAFGLKTHHSVAGPLTRYVEDAALLMEVLAGPHPADPSSVPVDIDFRSAVERPIHDLHIGYSPALEVFPVDPAVTEVVEEALGAFEAADATVDTVSVDHGLSIEALSQAIETTFATSVAGVAEVVRAAFGVDLNDHRDQLSDSLVELLEVADGKTLADVAASGIPRTQVYDAIEDVLADYDLLLTPTLSATGLDLRTDRGTDWPLALTWPFNWSGHPAASVPAGVTDEGHPVGLQIVGRQYADDTVLAASAAFERERPWHEAYRTAPIS